MVISYPGISSSNVNGNSHKISEKYFLVHTAYAKVPENVHEYSDGKQNHKEFDLVLKYNYRPWVKGQNYKTASSSLIADHVIMFRFKDDNGALAIKLRMRVGEKNLNPKENDLIVCKTQVVY